MKLVAKFVVMAAMCSTFMACTPAEPSIVCGREWNSGTQVVADTTSEFDLSDPFIVQFNYGKNFDFTSMKISFYEGSAANKGKEIWNRDVTVSSKMGSYTLQGKSSKGGLMTAREFTKQKAAGSIVVEFSTDGRVLASKEISLVKNK